MKATGIIRRVDDLGRIVIPKDIRRALRIREGDPLEVYVENDSVFYSKYSPMDTIASLLSQYAEVLNSVSAHSVLITNRDYVVAAAGVSKCEYLEKSITKELEDVIEGREPYKYKNESPIYPVNEGARVASVIYPIISKGEIYGSVVLLADDRPKTPSESELKLAQTTAAIIRIQLTE